MLISLCFLFVLLHSNNAQQHQYNLAFNKTCEYLTITSESLITTIFNATHTPQLVWIVHPYNTTSINCDFTLTQFTDLTYVYISVALTCLSIGALTLLGMLLAYNYFKRKSKATRRIYRNMI